MDKVAVSRAPWGAGPSLKTIAREDGVDFDRLISCLKQDMSDSEMSVELGISEKTAKHLREHFMTRGVGSIVGQD